MQSSFSSMRPMRPRDAAHDQAQRRRGADGKVLTGRPSVAQKSLPPRIAGADWQAGITPGNDCFRVTLNGATMPTAFAARASRPSIPGIDPADRADEAGGPGLSDVEGWVMVYVDPETNNPESAEPAHGRPSGSAALNIARTALPDPITGNDAAYKKLEGLVRILPGDDSCW